MHAHSIHRRPHAAPAVTAASNQSGSELAMQYRFGDCGVFAIAVYQETGWPVVLLRAPDGRVVHAACQVTKDTFYDAMGHTDLNGLRKCFGADVELDGDCDDDDLEFIFAPDEAAVAQARNAYFTLLMASSSVS